MQTWAVPLTQSGRVDRSPVALGEGGEMPKYMLHGSYTAAGAAGVLKDGGSGRLNAIEALAASDGGTIESA